ncbi:ADR218Wp [Eremothecium gossypii ATCC 10895]|uniref:Shugoshin n=1 Tax=Eremothecium gossypii (strain ATCC 10895 / CBS 109.51 / FGSC 9923 / NRRL Y-1056) TaxID=284811 RepID=SGO1_EREGS|nr:ADR218Wp [Eremothecium gossypii ATCC 10895]Q759Q5.2 RecName: Full=Shugoshin [Eremothecium gossypii ATCC 10895]AAS52138.2 ADR218Wp [Eremothecium gossypii ATCC 10895]AEY96437.1 FADR218Wp [Eremothecium gossypii FDAG1]
MYKKVVGGWFVYLVSTQISSGRAGSARFGGHLGYPSPSVAYIMARASRKANGSKAKSNSVQEYLDLISLQKQQFDQMRANYSHQNTQLAKSNSMLMIKITDLETKISELVQENVQLRSRLSVTELRFKERLNQSFNLLEHGAFQRFDEIVNLFAVVRAQQGLRPESAAATEQAQRRFKGLEQRGVSPKVVGFDVPSSDSVRGERETLDDRAQQHQEADSMELNVEETQPLRKKRRRSSRRESLFIPSDFDFSNDSLENALKEADKSRSAKDEAPSVAEDTITEEKHRESASRTTEQGESESRTKEASGTLTQSNEDGMGNDKSLQKEGTQQEDAANFTHSIIEYFIPEEYDVGSSDVANTSKSKLEVYRDDNEIESSQSTSSGECKELTGELSSAQPPFVQIPASSQSKIKHSLKPPRTSQRKIVVDEVMPHNDYSDATRPRRTRGKAVDYKWPSLRAKMRRPTDKLVDATTVTDIHELQVPTNRKLRKQREGVADSADVHGETDHEQDPEQSPAAEDVSVGLQSINSNIQKDEVSDQPLQATEVTQALPEDLPLRQPMALKDITNKIHIVQKPKKSLAKKPIIGDVSDENSYYGDDTSASGLRLNEGDLSVFDLIGGVKCSNIPKTHRARAKAERQVGKKPAFKVST